MRLLIYCLEFRILLISLIVFSLIKVLSSLILIFINVFLFSFPESIISRNKDTLCHFNIGFFLHHDIKLSFAYFNKIPLISKRQYHLIFRQERSHFPFVLNMFECSLFLHNFLIPKLINSLF